MEINLQMPISFEMLMFSFIDKVYQIIPISQEKNLPF